MKKSVCNPGSKLMLLVKKCRELIQTNLYYKLLLAMSLITIPPLFFLSAYSLYQTTVEVGRAVESSKQSIIQSTLSLQQENLESQSALINASFVNIINHVDIIRSITEDILNNPQDYNKPQRSTLILQDPEKGFYYSPQETLPGAEISNVFISNRITPGQNLLDELDRLKHLEPVMQSFVASNQNVVAVYFSFKESAARYYPKLDFKKMVAENLLPADLDMEKYEFYYGADQEHNPEKKNYLDKNLPGCHRQRTDYYLQRSRLPEKR